LAWLASLEDVLEKRRDKLTMVYFDNLDNEPLNKYKKNKNEKKIYRCVFLLLD
jgi:hypothetical protein